jgi:hypothetical protein
MTLDSKVAWPEFEADETQSAAERRAIPHAPKDVWK